MRNVPLHREDYTIINQIYWSCLSPTDLRMSLGCCLYSVQCWAYLQPIGASRLRPDQLALEKIHPAAPGGSLEKPPSAPWETSEFLGLRTPGMKSCWGPTELIPKVDVMWLKHVKTMS